MSSSSENSTHFISSKELIKISNISRATLNNYIKLGLLPKPLVKRPNELESRTKRMGYFPSSVIQSMNEIQLLKKAGKRIPDIVAERGEVWRYGQADQQAPTVSLSKNVNCINISHSNKSDEELRTRQNRQTSLSSNILDECITNQRPVLLKYTVLVANLQDSERISDELCPEEYFELIDQLWTILEGSCKKYLGVQITNTGAGIVSIFIDEGDSHYLHNSIRCSLEVREKMQRVSLAWKSRKGWDQDLYMNIGMNEGDEYFGLIPAAPDSGFAVQGKSIPCAKRLSEFARYGTIWTTKNMMNKLSLQERNMYRYGIRKKALGRENWMEKSFSRIVHLLSEQELKNKNISEYEHLPVTEIFEEKK